MMIPCLCFLRMALTYIVPVRYCMNRGSANGAPAGGAFLVDIPTEAVAEVRGPDELRLLIFSAAPWRGLEKSERGPSLASLFPPQADGLRHPASAAPCLRIAGRGPNNSSLLPPLAALVVVAVGSAAVRVLYRPTEALQTVLRQAVLSW